MAPPAADGAAVAPAERLSILREHNAPEEFIANFDESREGCTAHWIKVSASSGGSFTVTNGRNGFSGTYAAGGWSGALLVVRSCE